MTLKNGRDIFGGSLHEHIRQDHEIEDLLTGVKISKLMERFTAGHLIKTEFPGSKVFKSYVKVARSCNVFSSQSVTTR